MTQHIWVVERTLHTRSITTNSEKKFYIDKEFIGAVIGPGGKVIQEIQRETGATINIEEINSFGEVSIFSSNKESLNKG